MIKLHKLSLAQRLALIVGSALLGFVCITLLSLLFEYRMLMEERRQAVRQTVEIAHSLIRHYHSEASAGRMETADAQSQAKAALKGLRYSGAEYFWVNDLHPRMVLHPIKPELDGKDLSENKDPTGKKLFVEMVSTVRAEGAGFVSYMWPKPGSDKPVPKLSYVKGFEAWGWIVGSGVYIDTVNRTILLAALRAGVLAIGLIGVLLYLGIAVSRSLLAQIGGEPAYASAVMLSLASGDLNTRVALRPGDRSSMLCAVQSMCNGLGGLVREVRHGSESVATASSEIALGNMDLSQRTENQASALQRTAMTMDALGTTVKQNANKAHMANQLAQAASGVAIEGGQVVAKVVDTMKGISESSRKVAEIIGTIDGIAFQTNILALNAAVEAARAGDHGRGFAVVATEVRNLAKRCAAAAKDIKALITASAERVADGSAQVDHAGATITEAVSSIQRLKDIMGEISSASAEQSAGVAQVVQTISQLDHATQQNAALVEQSAAAAESLRSQAQHLVQAASAFRLDPADATRASGSAHGDVLMR